MPTHSSVLRSLSSWRAVTSKGANRLVGYILGRSQRPLSTKEIYALVTAPSQHKLVPQPKQTSTTSPPTPLLPKHCIRSISYLKNVVLPSMVAGGVVKLNYINRSLLPSEIEERVRLLPKAAKAERRTALEKVTLRAWRWEKRAAPKDPSKNPSRQKPGRDPLLPKGVRRRFKGETTAQHTHRLDLLSNRLFLRDAREARQQQDALDLRTLQNQVEPISV